MSQAIEKISSLIKALEAGTYDAKPSDLVQGPALQIEDITNTIEVTTFDDKHIKLQKVISVESSKSTTAQFDRQLSYGIFGGSASLEGELGQEETSDYVRITYPMCYYSSSRRVTVQSMLVSTVDGKKSDERAAADALKKLTGDIEFDVFRGKADFSNAGVFDGAFGAIAIGPAMQGVDVQIRSSDIMLNSHDLMFDEYGSDESVVLAGGATLGQELIEDAWVRSQMNMGEADRLFVDPKVLSNYNKIGYAKERIILAGSAQDASGVDLSRQWTSGGGLVKVESSRFLSGKTGPANQRTSGPATPTLTSAVPGAIAGAVTGFLAGQVFSYTVTAGNEVGESRRSNTVVAAAIAANGDGVTVTIANAGLTNVRHFNVYRSAAGGSVMKFIGRVRIAAGASTVFIDLGNKQPGFVTGYLLETDTMLIKELAPFSRLKMAVTELSQPEAYFRFLTLGALAPRKNVLLDNLR